MLVNFKLEKLDQLLLDFYTITGLSISVWDSEFNQLSFQPKEMNAFCKLMKSSPEGRRRCFICDKALCMKSAKSDKAVMHYCHAGLIDTAIPIKYKDTILGYMMFGQVTDKSDESKIAENLEQLSKEVHLNFQELLSAYYKLDKYNPDILPSATNVLKMATRYLWLAQYIEIVNNDLAAEIDAYIHEHYKEYISVSDICERFHISKNKLYSLSHKWFKTTIADYISKVKINEAINLLLNTDLPINQVCSKVGIDDYNYFTKVFKKQTGVTPLKYRKSYPFE